MLRDILEALDTAGHRYALIHAGRDGRLSLESDVDLAFDRPPNEVLVPILRRVATVHGARLVQCLHYEIPHGYYYVLEVAGLPRRFLHLDCLYDPGGINRYRVATPWLLDGAVDGAWGPQTRPERMALYLLTKRAIKGGDVSPQALDVLRACFASASEDVWGDVQERFGPQARGQVAQLLAAESSTEAASVLAQLRKRADRRFRRRHPLRFMLSLAMSGLRKVRRLAAPTGLFVVFVGPDGAGKSTVAGLLAARLDRAFRRTWRFHWRPGLLPQLGRALRRDAPQPARDPPQTFEYGRAVSLARFLYYWMDFVAGYWLTVHWQKARTALVVAERYFPDVIVHPQRYGFDVPRALLRWARKTVPSPDLLVLLEDNPAAIHARKAELSTDLIADQLLAYREEAKHWGRWVTLSTASGPDAVADAVGDIVLGLCAQRTAQRLARFAGGSAYRPFPSAARAKVWVSDADGLANALNLYHPYSTAGRFATAAAGRLPRRLQDALLQDRLPDGDAEALERVARVIRETLGSDGIVVSFAARATGEFGRLTCQASEHGRVVSYVKSGTLASHATRLEGEADMLAWLREVGFDGAAIPRVLATRRDDGRAWLFLSAPARPGSPRPLAPDAKDVQFLTALAALGRRTCVPAMLFGRDAWTRLVEATTRYDPSAAATLHAARSVVESHFAGDGFAVAAAHGDYAPWNALDLDDSRLYVFDWEHSSLAAPLLTDLFHRVFMPARLVQGHSASALVARLLRVAEDPLLGPVVAAAGIGRHEVPVYLLLYLITLATRERPHGEALDRFLGDSLRHVLASLGHSHRPRAVLVAAYACEPGHGSEPGVGWNMCQSISRDHETWVITRRNNRPGIEAALAHTPNPRLHFRYADLPRWARFWKRGERGIRTYYYLWQFAAWREARRVMRDVTFDVAHHVTFVNSYLFSFLALVPLPFVWGPIGSNPRLPAGLQASPRALLRDRLRFGFQRLVRAADPLFWLCAARAKVVVGINPAEAEHFPLSLLARTKFISHPSIGVEEDLLAQGEPRAGPVRVLAMGRLVYMKGFHLAIAAFASLAKSEPQCRLLVVGSGPERTRLEQQVRDAGLDENVEFIPWLPREKALALMREAHIFLFPSVEGSGMVVLEAMATGLPVVCLRYGGPGTFVSAECGIAVDVGTPEETVRRLGDALVTLARDPALRMTMGRAAKQRVEHAYLWRDRPLAIRRWYARALPASSLPREQATEARAMPSPRDEAPGPGSAGEGACPPVRERAEEERWTAGRAAPVVVDDRRASP